MRRVLVLVVAVGLEHGQVGRVLAPAQMLVRGFVGVQRTQPAALGVVQPDPVPDLVVGVDRHGQEMPLVLPRHLGHVAQAERLPGREGAHHDVHAFALLPLGLVAPQRHVEPVLGERERLDVVHGLLLARQQVEKTELVAHGLLRLLHPLPLVRRDADRVGQPAVVRSEHRPRGEGDDDHRIGVGGVHAQFAFVVDPADSDGEPAAVGRERPAAQAFPLAVVVNGQGGLFLGLEPGHRRGGCHEGERADQERAEKGKGGAGVRPCGLHDSTSSSWGEGTGQPVHQRRLLAARHFA